MKILIADDDQTIVKILGRLVQTWGYSVVSATNGQQAFDLLQQDPEIGIAILDWQMPEILGVDVIRQVRATQKERPLYLLLLTSHNEKDFLMQGFQAGADDFLSKPFDRDVIRARLHAGQRIITAQRQLIERNNLLDEEVRERTVDLQKAVTVAERASEMKSHFLANMSHEIRTPLNGIMSYIELLLYSDLSAEQTQDLQTIRSCAHSLRTIINDVLDFSKIEAGQMSMEAAPFSVVEATEEIIGLLRITAQEKDIDVIFTNQFIPDQVIGDRIRYQQIVTNLLSNAIKFSPMGRAVSILIQPNAEASEYHDFGGFHLTVSDTGLGIPKSKYEKIFEGFTQADSSTTRKYGGTGLGLTIVRKLSQLMDGSVWVKSIEGIGSTFHVVLPLLRTTEYQHADAPIIDVDADFRGVSVLLAEDNLTNQQAIKRMLEKTGCVVQTANNGQEVLEAFSRQPTQIVLLDIQMPVMGGEEAARCLRNMTQTESRLPIVALTANIFTEDKERYIAAGIDEILGKPICYPELFRVMKQQLLQTTKGATING